MKGIKLLVATFLLAISGLHAQSVKGKLLDPTDNKPLSGATLTLTSLRDSSTKFSTISASNGVFEFRNVSNDSFALRVSFIGYEDFKQIVGVKDSTVDLGTVFVPKAIKQLSEVTVIAKAPPIQQKDDTIQYNASQFKVNPDATAEDMMKKVPGVTIDKQGNVTAQGEQVKKVTIDGREFFGDDATAALRNMPAEIIDKIQVFDRLSDQAQFTGFDDGNTTKAVNIVTKSNMRNGQFGRLYAGYGTDSRYSAGGNVSFFKNNRRISLVGLSNNINQQNFSTQDLLGVTSSGGNRGGGGGGGNNRGGGGQGGNRGGGGGSGNFGGGGQNNFLVGQQNGISKTNAIGINYSDVYGKKLTVTGSYFFNNSNNTNQQITDRQTKISSDSTLFYKENSLSSSNNYNHRINLRLDYKIDSSNSLLITPNISFQKNNSASFLSAVNSFDGVTPTSEATNDVNAVADGYNISNTVLYRHSFAKRGRTVSVGLTTSFNHKTGQTYLTSDNKSFDESGNMIKDSVRQQFTDNLNNGQTVSTNIAYTEPLSKKSQLQINYSPSFTKNKADQAAYEFDANGGKYSLFDTSLSNKFNNTYNTQNAGLSYRTGDRTNQFSAGVNYQYSALHSDEIFPFIATVDKKFSNLLPNLQFRRKVSPRSSVNIFYRTSVTAPSISQLQNVINNTNTLLLTTGNPDLQQQYTHSLVSRYTFTNTQKGQSFFANLFLQKTNDYIANATYIARNDSLLSQKITLYRGSQLTKPVNLNGYWSVRSFLTYGQPVKFIKSNVNVNGGFTYSRLPGIINNLQTITNTYTYNAGAVVASNVSEYIDFTLSYNGAFNIIGGQQSNNYFTQTAGIQFNLLAKSGWFFQNDLNNQFYNYKDPLIKDQNFWLWNMSAGKKFLKAQAGELKLSVFDLLKQNRSITRTVTETYIEDVQSQVLRQYFMLTFSYKLKNFGKAKTNSRPNSDFRRDF
jgi:uncharacterized membrane protein YgcG